MRTHAPALLISALVHLGLLALVLAGVMQLPRDSQQEQRLAVSLEMFQPSPPPEPIQEPMHEPIQEPTPEPAPEPVTEPEPEPAPVEVAPPPPPKPQPQPKPKPEPKPEPKPAPEPKPEPPPKVQQVEPATPPPPPVVPAVTAPPAVDTGLIQRLEDEYKSALRQAIEANKGYPRRAVRLRQEGEVVVGFTILGNGTIRGARIVEGSGSQLLDKAALAAVEKVSGRLPFPEELQRQQWEFTIPINYALR